MRHLIVLFLCISLLVNGCKSRSVDEAGLYQRPGWWERRMDRLDDWNTHHGYALNKAKTAMLYTLIIGGTLTAVVASAMIHSDSDKQSVPKNPYQDSWFWSTSP